MRTKQSNLQMTVASITLVSITMLSGCSQYNKDSTLTLADHQQAMQMIVNSQDSRNNGAWGAVYMAPQELRDFDRDIVDISVLPAMSHDSNLARWQTKFEDGSFVTTNGKRLYNDSCAGCHMVKGEGASGAGYYPPLANNSKMQSKYYIIDVLINGLRGMPSFHQMMNDEQIAAVTQYVLSDLNNFEDTVTAANVAQLRHEHPPGSDPSE